MGLLDEAMRDLAVTLASTFRDNAITITRSTTVYVPATGVDTETLTVATVVAPPPSVVKNERGTLSVRLEGTYAYSIPAKDLVDAAGTAFVPALGDVLTDGVLVFALVEVNPIMSGDQVAIYKVYGKK